MFEGFKLRRKKQLLELRALELEERALAQMGTILEGTLAKDDPDKDDWILVGKGETPVETEMDLDKARSQCRDLYYNNPTGHGLVHTFVKFVIGKGINIRSAIPDKELKDDVQREWEDWQRTEGFLFRQHEAVRRAFRDGEAFIQLGTDAHGLTLRFWDPAKVASATDGMPTWGIWTKSGDVEKVEAYRHNGERVEAHEVIHMKIGVDANVKRGLPLMWAVRKRIKQYDSWLMDRLVLNKIRSAIALLRKHEGGPAAVSSFVEAQKTSTVTKAEGTYPTKKLRPGSIIDAPAGVTYEFLAPNIDARDVKADGRAILLTIAAGGGVAEYMVSADASNANYASTMVAESPAVKEFEYWQALFAANFVDIYLRWFAKAQAARRIPAEATTEVVADAPPLVNRDALRYAKGCEVLFDARVMSKQSWQQRAGLNPETEDANMEAEGAPEKPPKGSKKDDAPRGRDVKPSLRGRQGSMGGDIPPSGTRDAGTT